MVAQTLAKLLEEPEQSDFPPLYLHYAQQTFECLTRMAQMAKLSVPPLNAVEQVHFLNGVFSCVLMCNPRKVAPPLPVILGALETQTPVFAPNVLGLEYQAEMERLFWAFENQTDPRRSGSSLQLDPTCSSVSTRRYANNSDLRQSTVANRGAVRVQASTSRVSCVSVLTLHSERNRIRCGPIRSEVRTAWRWCGTRYRSGSADLQALDPILGEIQDDSLTVGSNPDAMINTSVSREWPEVKSALIDMQQYISASMPSNAELSRLPDLVALFKQWNQLAPYVLPPYVSVYPDTGALSEVLIPYARALRMLYSC